MGRVARKGEGRHKACPYGWFEVGKEGVARKGEGRHKACPYGWFEVGKGGVAREWGGGWGRSMVAAGGQGRITRTLAAAGGFRGGVAGAEPPHKGGPNRPDRPELQWLVVSGQWGGS